MAKYTIPETWTKVNGAMYTHVQHNVQCTCINAMRCATQHEQYQSVFGSAHCAVYIFSKSVRQKRDSLWCTCICIILLCSWCAFSSNVRSVTAPIFVLILYKTTYASLANRHKANNFILCMTFLYRHCLESVRLNDYSIFCSNYCVISTVSTSQFLPPSLPPSPSLSLPPSLPSLSLSLFPSPRTLWPHSTNPDLSAPTLEPCGKTTSPS